VEYVPVASGFGAGTKEFADRANALRIILADAAAAMGSARGGAEHAVVLAADLDDATGEEMAAVADRLRDAGALDVTLLSTVMKKGRPGVRLEVLADPGTADALESMMLRESTTIGVRRYPVSRAVLPREIKPVEVRGHVVRVKVVTLPDGSTRAKPESDDVGRVSAATGMTAREVSDAARAALDGSARK
jgi:uncharacterized protein (DUF111 family)